MPASEPLRHYSLGVNAGKGLSGRRVSDTTPFSPAPEKKKRRLESGGGISSAHQDSPEGIDAESPAKKKSGPSSWVALGKRKREGEIRVHQQETKGSAMSKKEELSLSSKDATEKDTSSATKGEKK